MLTLIDLAETMEAKSPGKGVAAWKQATGQTVPTLEYLEAHLTDVDCTTKSEHAKRAALLQLARQFPTVADVNRKAVRAWATKMITDGTLKRASVVRLLSSCRMYWRYLRDIEGVVAEGLEPFDNLGLPRGKNGSAKATEKAPVFSASDRNPDFSGHRISTSFSSSSQLKYEPSSLARL